jgi:thiopeptide-type bacteriocin biosynthesis protein
MALSISRYLVRMRGRATPFGIFAGVASLRFGNEVSVQWTGSHHARARADAVWLADVIAQLESLPVLRCRLQVIVNDLVVLRGGRLVVLWLPHGSDPRRSPTAVASVRHSPAVQTVVNAAQSSIQFGDLLGKLAAEIPEIPVTAIDGMLAELMARGVLITSLRPPSTSCDGLAHVLARLQEVGADTLAEAAPLVQELYEIHAQLEASGTSTGWADGPARSVLGSRMRTLSAGVEQPLMVDLRLDCAVELPLHVAAEAAAAAGALMRLTPHPAGNVGWRDYHSRFLARYGARALVPVEHLVDPTVGLGFPAHYSGQSVVPSELSQRDQRLLMLAQQAALDGAVEIVLDDDAIAVLAGDGLDAVQPAPHMELCAEVRAPTAKALAEGDFTLEVIGTGRTAAALTGRFLTALPDSQRQRMLSQYGVLPVGVDGALPAQLAFPPLLPRMENVACAPRLLPDVISLAEHRNGIQGRILVDDLAVTADNDRMYVVSLSRRRVVEPMLTNAAAQHTMPPIARFLFELPRARSGTVSPFAWGVAGCLPFLPRVRYGRTVLAPARWQLPVDGLPGPDAPWATWMTAMANLRGRLGLPASVNVGTGDRLLRLSLDDRMGLALLRAHLDGSGDDRTVSEASTAADHGWFDGRAHEIVIPLASTTPPACSPAILTASGPLSLIGHEEGILPGTQILFAKLFGNPGGFDTILRDHLPTLLAVWGGEPPLWWFVRYSDPTPHLRLRLHLDGGHDYGQAVVRVGEWAVGLRRHGLIGDLVLDTYHPETARYGSGATLRAAEGLFAADSAAVLAQLSFLASRREIHPHALTAASMVDLASAVMRSRAAGMGWLIDLPLFGRSPGCDREVVRQAVCLADTQGKELFAVSGGLEVVAAWQARREAAETYAEELAADGASLDQASVLGSLLHMHHARAHGIDSNSERQCDRLARAVALSWSARHDSAEGGLK